LSFDINFYEMSLREWYGASVWWAFECLWNKIHFRMTTQFNSKT